MQTPESVKAAQLKQGLETICQGYKDKKRVLVFSKTHYSIAVRALEFLAQLDPGAPGALEKLYRFSQAMEAHLQAHNSKEFIAQLAQVLAPYREELPKDTDAFYQECLQYLAQKKKRSLSPNSSPEATPSPSPDPEGQIFKMVICGDPQTGKTSVSNRLVHNDFETRYVPTMGASIRSITLPKSQNQLKIFDVASNAQLAPVYARGAQIYIFCFSVMDADSLKNIETHWQLLHPEPDAHVYLVGTKTDFGQHAIVQEGDAKAMATKCGMKGPLYVSNKDRVGIDELLETIVQALQPAATVSYKT